MSVYQNGHQRINADVVKNPMTYWTHQFYADAFFAEKAYGVLNKSLKGN
jgi:hypothetical protein